MSGSWRSYNDKIAIAFKPYHNLGLNNSVVSSINRGFNYSKFVEIKTESVKSSNMIRKVINVSLSGMEPKAVDTNIFALPVQYNVPLNRYATVKMISENMILPVYRPSSTNANPLEFTTSYEVHSDLDRPT